MVRECEEGEDNRNCTQKGVVERGRKKERKRKKESGKNKVEEKGKIRDRKGG